VLHVAKAALNVPLIIMMMLTKVSVTFNPSHPHDDPGTKTTSQKEKQYTAHTRPRRNEWLVIRWLQQADFGDCQDHVPLRSNNMCTHHVATEWDSLLLRIRYNEVPTAEQKAVTPCTRKKKKKKKMKCCTALT
jgi:hypothetical protein